MMPIDNPRIEQAAALMLQFAERTGLTTSVQPVRYLWTDAFAVCNFLGLSRATGDEQYQTLARDLVGQVHDVLGRHRDDDPRSGRLGGQDHPTRGGLRIGKGLPERGPDESYVSFWLETGNRRAPTWTELEDINADMLATALAPEGFLVLSGQSFA